MQLLWDSSLYARLRFYVKVVTPKCFGGPPVDRDRLNAHPGPSGYGYELVALVRVLEAMKTLSVSGLMNEKSVVTQSPPVDVLVWRHQLRCCPCHSTSA
ncbi:hypothetical protein TNCV_676381 [Trichonephila clavipes]|nr:hypothetical protein TNCV_676381 [Trichonephila clavipes]